MSYYVYGSGVSYQQYLQAKSFVTDISSASRKAGREVSMEISRQTRDVIASNAALARENIRVSERQNRERIDAIDAASDRITGALSEGFDRVSYELQDISSGISELNATFHWGFGQMLAGIGHMNDALSELIKIAKTPVQTVAFNHFEIARDAFRQCLYQEALEELQKSIQGDHTSPGYKLEWRFHQMAGTIRLGFVDCDLALLNLIQAEESFLMAARYAKVDYPEDAARAFLSAGWAAYCQGKMKEALTHTEQAIMLSPKLTEALFQAAKVRMALGEVDSALPVLRQAIDEDRFYVLKAAGDGDFQKHDDKLRVFLEALRSEKYQQTVPKIKEFLEKIKFWRENSAEAANNTDIQYMVAFLTEGKNWPLLDIFAFAQNLDTLIIQIQTCVKDVRITIAIQLADVSSSYKEKYQEQESYKEEVLIKPGWFLRKPVTEMQTKTRTVTKTRMVRRTLKTIRNDIYSGSGKLMTNIEFCQIPGGTFLMGSPEREDDRGSDETQHSVKVGDFYLGKYPVTQGQWQAVMGSNPSHFKGDSKLPVEEVSWDDCQVFINKLNKDAGKNSYRLATEAEWEYACRAGTTMPFNTGENLTTNQANYDKRKTTPVGSFPPNRWGLYDMHGNVYEWCFDWFDGDYYAECKKQGLVENPTGPETGSRRVYRGGSWDSCAQFCRAADRFIVFPAYLYGFIGFRLVFVPQSVAGHADFSSE